MFEYCLCCAGNQCLFSQHANITPVKDHHLQDTGLLVIFSKTTWSIRQDVQGVVGSPCEDKCGESLGLGLQLSAEFCSVLQSACCCALFLATIQVGETSLLWFSGAGDFNWVQGVTGGWAKVRRSVLQVVIFTHCFWTQSVGKHFVSEILFCWWRQAANQEPSSEIWFQCCCVGEKTGIGEHLNFVANVSCSAFVFLGLGHSSNDSSLLIN